MPLKNDDVVLINGDYFAIRGTVPSGSTWTKNPVPCGSFIETNRGSDCSFGNCGSSGNANPPQVIQPFSLGYILLLCNRIRSFVLQFTPPEGCDEHCWGYQPCNVGFEHPSYEGWCDKHPGGGGDPDRRIRPSNGTFCKSHHENFPDCANGKQGEGCCHTSA